jgi:hypothetical protein
LQCWLQPLAGRLLFLPLSLLLLLPRLLLLLLLLLLSLGLLTP